MPYLILAVLLTVMQAAPPVPRKAADNTTGSRQYVKSQSSPDKAPAQPSSPAINADATNRDETENNGVGSKNAEQPIRITELPSVSVRAAKRDWADWGYWVFSGLLVFVGGFQAWLLFKTLRAIQRQADIYEQQRTQMVKAGEQTDQLIGTMRDTAIRELRAYVGITTARMTFFQERAPLIEILIKNSGKTPAYDVGMWISGRLGPYPLNIPLPPPPIGFRTSRSIIGPGEEPHAMVWKHPTIDEDDMPILGTPELTIFIYGEIVYKDAFGYPRFARFRLLYGGVERANRWDENGIAVTFLRADTEGNEAD